MSTEPTSFTTEEADEIFMNDFVMGTSGLIQAEILKANDLYDNLGELWFDTEQKLSGLKGEAAHEPTEDSSLVEDVRFAVEHTLNQLWDTEPPVTKGRSLAGRRVPLKMSAIAASKDATTLVGDVDSIRRPNKRRIAAVGGRLAARRIVDGLRGNAGVDQRSSQRADSRKQQRKRARAASAC